MNNWMELRLTKDEEEFVQRNAATYRAVHVATLDTLFGWAKAIEILQKRFYSSGIQGGFADALTQYGFTSRDGGPMAKSIRSNLKNLLDNEPAVRQWWDGVPERKKRNWISARAIHRHWQAALKSKDSNAPRKPHPITELKRTNLKLQEQLHKALNPKDDVRDRFDPKDTADDIAAVLVRMFRESKAEDIARRTLAKLKEKKRKSKKPVEDDQAESADDSRR